LVAEEVERVYPELVTYGLDGKVETVRYSMLTSMLLNELQKQTRELQNQTRENQGQAEQLSKLSAQVAAVKTSTRREVAELNASYQRALQSMQERLATMEQAVHARKGGRNLTAAFNR